MSLTSFHLLFVATSLLLALGCGLVGVQTYAADGNSGALVWGVLSLLAVPVLAVYGVKVRRKLRDLESGKVLQ